MHFPIHIKSTRHLFPKSDSVGVTFNSIFSTNVAVIYFDAIKLCLTRAFSFTLPRLLGSSQNNRTQIADRKGDREIYRVKNLGNEYMPNWYAEGEVEGTRSLLDLTSADILQTRWRYVPFAAWQPESNYLLPSGSMFPQRAQR